MMGERLGKWILSTEIGRGGMGRVYLAKEELTGRNAAVKILAAELAQDQGFLHRFQREIETLSQLNHPHIVRFFDSGEENGHYYFAMEFVEGESLEDIREHKTRLPWRHVVDIGLQISPALKHVHDHGVIHRDLKLSNLLVREDGIVKLTDFGIAKVFASTHFTQTGGVVGTAEYLSPEQAMGKPVTKKSDIYSLGVVFYYLVTGRLPFEGSNFLELLHKHRYALPDRPQKIVPEIPYELDELICQMLEKDPGKRPPDCMVLTKQLDAIRMKLARKDQSTRLVDGGQTIAEQRPGLSPQGPGVATLMSRLVREELDRQNRGGPIHQFLNRPTVVVILLLLCLGAIAYAFWPLNQEALFRKGGELMASTRLADMETAWRDYLEPLNQRFPEHPHKDEVERDRKLLENARKGQQSDAQRFFLLGETP